MIHSRFDDDAVREALRGVDDPEAGMNIVDLGLVYGIDVTADVVHVDMTMTTAACPMAEMITDQARAVIAAIAPEGTTVDVRLVWDPPWTPDKMTGVAREHFGWG
ncbi:MAG: metal-sulfur cluster assembly factor [Betaproteobacteria bacterium]|nr:metal-sulfur cluster assembly factor [Betaproteobacteria bacterium]MDE2211008.1 metal-sulfur cluster assembly factor [Betaproteobacteria bacterium]MDE2358163.1 metal-sulfur cluster assembly factor [Betaproteobacteria bacterium]